MSQKITIAPVLEISSAILTDALTQEDIAQFLSHPKNFVCSKLKTDIVGVDITVATNNKSEVHLALPYYSGIEAAKAQALQDGSLNDISGGELLITLGAVGGLLIGQIAGTVTLTALGGIIGGAVGAAALAGVIGGTTTAIRAKKGQNVDGSPK